MMGSHSAVKMSMGVTSRHVKVFLRRKMPSARGTCRLQSTSTMSLVSSQQHTPFQTYNSTLVYSEKKDFSTALASDAAGFYDEQWNALVSAASQTDSHDLTVARARELDLVEAASAINDHDKILLLVRHGDAAENTTVDPLMSGRGVGQVLNLSRRTATFCNDDTGLIPELVVTSPLKRAMQTALMIFPEYSPAASLREVPWICHGGLVEKTNHVYDVPSSRDELEKMFPGVDFSLYDDLNVTGDLNKSLVESKLDLLGQTNDFLHWLKQRKERVIVVSSHSTWLQSFCGCTLRYEPEEAGSEAFQTGEMRALGVKFE